MKKIKLKDKLTYAYIRKIKKWIFCPSCRKDKMHINKDSSMWTCESCGYKLSVKEFEDDYIFWFCDECDSYLNIQEGFDRNSKTHICNKCGYKNDTTLDNLKGICSDCGKLLSDPDATLCRSCKIERLEKAKEFLQTVSTDLVEIAEALSSFESVVNTDSAPLNYEYEEEPKKIIEFKCANCGNTNHETLWDEGDTIYCSRCCHRTRVADGEDDLELCPVCHHMKDRKAYYCMWCNNSGGEGKYDPEAYKEAEEFLKTVDEKNLRFIKFKKK